MTAQHVEAVVPRDSLSNRLALARKHAGHVSRILSKALGPHWTGHTLRHSFATKALSGSGDLRSVQILMGHASPTTTARYTEVADETLEQVVRRIA